MDTQIQLKYSVTLYLHIEVRYQISFVPFEGPAQDAQL